MESSICVATMTGFAQIVAGLEAAKVQVTDYPFATAGPLNDRLMNMTCQETRSVREWCPEGYRYQAATGGSDSERNIFNELRSHFHIS